MSGAGLAVQPSSCSIHVGRPPLESGGRKEAGTASNSGHCLYRLVPSSERPFTPATAPCRAIQDLHRETAQKLRVDNGCIEEVEALLKQLEQLLVGISIMQVRVGWGAPGGRGEAVSRGRAGQ